MPLSPGDAVLVQYKGSKEWHGRYLLAHVHEHCWIIITPDDDRYMENLGPKSGEIERFRSRGPDVVVPFGVDARKVYDFNPHPTKEQIAALCREGEIDAGPERLALGLPEVPEQQLVAAPAEPSPSVAGGAPSVPGSVKNDRKPGAVVPADGPGQTIRGASDLAAALSMPRLGGGFGAPRRDGQATPRAEEDVRTLPVRYDRSGRRHREFRDYCSMATEDEWDDWPIRGPRTTRWVIDFMLEHGGTPCGWHRRWQSEMRLDSASAGVALHESCCLILESLCCYDQINAPNSAAAEHCSRQIQMVEERWKDRAVGASEGDSAFGEMHLFAGKQTRGNLCLCPDLVEWISDQLKNEASINKERRKAREERSLAKPKKEGK